MRCPDCPVAADKPCLGVTPRFAHFCQWASEGGPAKLGMIRDRSALPVDPVPTPAPAPTYPPLWKQAAGLAGAVVTHVAAGLPTLDAEAVAARLAVCAGCPEHVADENRCRICGCSISIKAGWADQKCPLGKWPT